MNELDMSKPGSELFQEPSSTYSSYTDAPSQGHVVDDPLNTGVNQNFDAADQGQLSDQQKNFRALREEVSKALEEKQYWKGQAEAYAAIPRQPEQTQSSQQDAFSALDLEDSRDVKKAFDAIRQENVTLRQEIKHTLSAIETKTQRKDWNELVTQHVPKLTNENPIFAEMIQKSSNPYEAAYALSQLNAKASHIVPDNFPQQGMGQRAINNASKPQTLASVGGQGQLSAADYYANMSDKDFHEIAARNLANI